MKIFIWEYAGKVSNNYHSGGGLVVIANDIAEANELINADGNIDLTNSEFTNRLEFEVISETTSKVIVFPDAGCC